MSSSGGLVQTTTCRGPGNWGRRNLATPLLSWFILYLFLLGPVGGRDMATQEEGHRLAGPAPHTHVGPVRPSPLLRRGGKWSGGGKPSSFGSFLHLHIRHVVEQDHRNE